MRLKNSFLVVLASLSLFVASAGLLPVHASAATTANCDKVATSFLGFPTWYKYLTFDASKDCEITFDVKEDVPKLALALFEIILRVGGLVAVAFIIIGGFRYLTSQGEPDALKGARTTIINALIGLVITLSATIIVNLIAGSFN